MASYRYKVIKGGKVIGEATTRADAEAGAKKHGGQIVEVVEAKARAKNPTKSAPKAKATKPVKRNPPLEPHSAATLLDAVKPGAPQQIHGAKVARVGAGYSVDGKAMTRAQVLKALEAGRASNPKQNAYSGGSTMSADDYVRFCHAYAISRVLEGASKDLALLAVRQLGTLAQNGDPIRIDRTIRDAWASAKLPGKPTEKALHDGATAFVSSAADRETNPKGKPTTAKASGRKSGLLPHAAPYAGKEQIEYYNEQADIAEAAGDVESQRTALRNMIAAAKKFGATLDAQIAQSLLDDTYKSHSPKANPKTAKASGRKIQYV